MTRAAKVSWAGLAALAVAMGVGRFAFTPVLPMMQHDHGLTLGQGGWLASANYVGYLVGALVAMRSRLRPGSAIVGSLAAICAATLAAAMTDRFALLLALRFIPGFGSALVLVYVSAWALEALAAERRPRLGGVVFAGVGIGIASAGLLCLALVAVSASSDAAWIALGALASLATAAISRFVWRTQGPMPRVHAEGHAAGLGRYWRLIYAHAAFGFGYIIPATFLPVMAKEALGGSPSFGWAWPIFGGAAALSTWLCARMAGRIAVRRVWAASLVVMALGVACPVVLPGLGGIVLAALAVGATFMVATMLAMQEARRVAGEAARPLMGAMTTAFALGQVGGPLVAGAGIGFSAALVIAAIPLCAAAFFLYLEAP